MNNFATRLKEERTRLGLSQAAFAEKIGIHRNTQIKYESGEREPDIAYLEGIEKIGIDGQYVMTGVREEESQLHDMIIARVFFLLMAALGAEREQADRLIELAFGIEKQTMDLHDGHHVAMSRVAELVNSTIAGLCIDIPTMTDAITAFETSTQAGGLIIQPKKKAQAIAMLCRVIKSSGKIDQAMIDDAVRLAAS